MPWQREVALVAGEMVRDEESGVWVPAYPEVFITVPRQSGKTLLLLSWHLDRAIAWEPYDGKPQAVVYTAQSGSDARKKFRKEHLPLLRSSRSLYGMVEKERLSAEDSGLDYRNGSTYTIWATSEAAGHGSTVDLVEMDEIFDDEDDRREQAAIPATATRKDAQALLSSTAGTEKSMLYLRKQEAGRAAVVAGRREGMAYFEFSADPEDDPEDPTTWRSCHPALGFTISERTVASALERMRKEDGDLSEFSRAWLNITKRSSGEQLIPKAAWAAACSDSVRVEGRRVFGLSASLDRSHASVVVADHEGRVAVVEHRPGVGWLEDRAVELWDRWRAPVAVDVGDPAGYLAARLEERRVDVRRYSAQTYAHACGAFFDRLIDGGLAVFPHPGLDGAVAAASKRSLGEAWAWSRKGDADISPLVAATLAADAAVSLPPPSPRVVNLNDV